MNEPKKKPKPRATCECPKRGRNKSHVLGCPLSEAGRKRNPDERRAVNADVAARRVTLPRNLDASVRDLLTHCAKNPDDVPRVVAGITLLLHHDVASVFAADGGGANTH